MNLLYLEYKISTRLNVDFDMSSFLKKKLSTK